MSGKRKFDVKGGVVGGDAHDGVMAIARVEAAANVGQAHTIFSNGGGFGVEGIFNGEGDAAVLAAAGNADEAAFGEMSDAMSDGVFNERLEEKRRKVHGLGIFGNVFLHAEAGAEADFFDGEIALKQSQLFRKRNSGFFAEAERHAKKFGEEDAHFAGSGGIHAGEGADGVETVEKKMRVDLSFQGFQFGIASENAGFEGAGFGAAGIFESENDVVSGDGEEIKKKSSAEEKRNLRAEALRESVEGGEIGERCGKKFGGGDPEEADDGSSEKMRGAKTRGGAFLDGSGFAGVPRGKTDKLIDEAQGNQEETGGKPAEATGYSEEIGENGGEGRPGEQVDGVAADGGEERMHKNWLVADLHASKNDGASDDESFGFAS